MYRIAPERAHLVAGFGRIHWIERSGLLTIASAALAEAEAGIVAHMQSVRRTFARMGGARPGPPSLDRKSVTPRQACAALRQSTDMLWFGSERLRRLARNDIRRIYYVLLAAFVVWGILYMNITVPLIVLAISANIANFTMALSAILTIRLNRKTLPKAFRGSVFREAMLVANVLFFGFFFSVFMIYKVLS